MGKKRKNSKVSLIIDMTIKPTLLALMVMALLAGAPITVFLSR